MAKSIKDNLKIRRGRPTTGGAAPLVGVRMPKELQAKILAWAKDQPESPKLATAIRQLVELGLGKSVIKSKSAATSERAKELASATIDSLVESAPPEERASRKRRLIKGPSEFREARIDRPKQRK